MSEPVHRADGTIDPHGRLRQAIADAIRERLDAADWGSLSLMPGVMPPQPWDHEPEYDGPVSVYELADAVLSKVLASAASASDAYAHQLAEQQRALADANDELDHDHHVYGFSNAVRQAADLIDPQSAGPVCPDEEPTP